MGWFLCVSVAIVLAMKLKDHRLKSRGVSALVFAVVLAVKLKYHRLKSLVSWRSAATNPAPLHPSSVGLLLTQTTNLIRLTASRDKLGIEKPSIRTTTGARHAETPGSRGRVACA